MPLLTCPNFYDWGRAFRPGTRVRLISDLKADSGAVRREAGSEGVVVWCGNSRANRGVLKTRRIGVRFDGEDKPRFFGARESLIQRADGLSVDDVKRGRVTPDRQWIVQELRSTRTGTRTFGTDRMTDAQREELRRIARAHPEAGYAVVEVTPGRTAGSYGGPTPEASGAMREAQRVAAIWSEGDGRCEVAVWTLADQAVCA